VDVLEAMDSQMFSKATRDDKVVDETVKIPPEDISALFGLYYDGEGAGTTRSLGSALGWSIENSPLASQKRPTPTR
jgi:serine protease inhibitor